MAKAAVIHDRCRKVLVQFLGNSECKGERCEKHHYLSNPSLLYSLFATLEPYPNLSRPCTNNPLSSLLCPSYLPASIQGRLPERVNSLDDEDLSGVREERFLELRDGFSVLNGIGRGGKML